MPWTPKPNAAQSCGCDSLLLSFPDVFAFGICNERHCLQDDIGYEPSDQSVNVVRRVEQWHVQHPDVCSFARNNASPLFDDFSIVASHAVDGLNDKKIAASDLSFEAFPTGSVEVLAALLVDHEILWAYAHEFHRVNFLASFWSAVDTRT